MYSMPTIKDLIGQVFSKVTATENSITFLNEVGKGFQFYHEQDCCEDVRIESIVGDLADLENAEILHAEEAMQDMEDAEEHGTWTFYKFATRKGYVDIRWIGESNGYYSEAVDIRRIGPVKQND